MDGGRHRTSAIRLPSQTPIDEREIHQIWENLKNGIQEIQRKNHSGLNCEELYRNAYTMVLYKHGDKLYTSLRETIEEHLQNNVRSSVEATTSASGRILPKIIEVWGDHTIAMGMIRDITMYLGRVYVPFHKLESVYNLGLNSFRDEIIRHNGINDRLRRETLDLILSERKGQQIDWSSLNKACGMLSALSEYGSEFEQTLLKETSDFYKTVGEELLQQSNSASEYIQQVEQYLNEDCGADLLEKETKKLLGVVERELISNHMQKLADMDRGGVIAMLEGKKIEDMRKMYTIFSRVNNGRMVFCNAVTRWLRSKGEELSIMVRSPVETMISGGILHKIIEVWEMGDILIHLDDADVNMNDSVLSSFRDEIIRHNGINDRLRREMLDLILAERKGQQIDWVSVKNACSMLSDLRIYENEFEQPFLKETSEFYMTVGQELLQSNSASEYVQRAEHYLHDESSRADRILEIQTRKKLLDVVDRVVSSRLQTVIEMDLVAMLEDNKIEDMSEMYTIFSLVDRCRMVICNVVSRWLRPKGDEISSPALQSEELKKDPILYISRLVELKERCDRLIVAAFNEDKDFQKQIDSDFEHFVNLNSHAAIHLTAFLDDKLKKGNRVLNDVEIDESLDRAMTFFRFLSEKDLFEHFYKRSLAKRLLTDRSVSDDAEKLVVSRLKTECGYQFSCKLELMLKDGELWATLQAGFRDYVNSQPDPGDRDPCEIQMRVLTSGAWPTQNVTTLCHLPSEACSSFDAFTEFYMRQHNGRKLTLNTYLGSADVRATFYNPIKEECTSQAENDAGTQGPRTTEVVKILNVSTHQMTVLLLFNEKPAYTFNELLDATKLPEQELLKTAQSLSMGKPTQRVLVRTGGAGKYIEKNDVFMVNDQFTSKLVRVKISTIADNRASNTTVSKEEANHVREQVAEDRKYEIECAIVRVMKERKQLEHNNLIAEVIQQLSARFQPNPTVIKQRVEALIERDYLIRDRNSANLYEYVS